MPVTSHVFYTFLDLCGTFAFAISGAVAARQRGLDLFGIAVVAFIVACGGGIVRDLCIGAIPPVGLSDWRYLTTVLVAAAIAIVAHPLVTRMDKPVMFFDAIGLGIFAVAGAQKSLAYGHNAELAILLGVTSAVGGGIMRDVLLSRIPAILTREIYALAALLGAMVQVGFFYSGMAAWWTPWVATAVAVSARLASLYFGWSLPAFGKR